MENKGKITTVAMTTKWYETKPLIAYRTIKKLKKWTVEHLESKRCKLHTNTLITQCDKCKTLKLTVYWRVAQYKDSHKFHYGNSVECDYCWTCKKI